MKKIYPLLALLLVFGCFQSRGPISKPQTFQATFNHNLDSVKQVALDIAIDNSVTILEQGENHLVLTLNDSHPMARPFKHPLDERTFILRLFIQQQQNQVLLTIQGATRSEMVRDELNTQSDQDLAQKYLNLIKERLES